MEEEILALYLRYLKDLRDSIEKIGKSVLQSRRLSAKLREEKNCAAIFIFDQYVIVARKTYEFFTQRDKNLISEYFRFIKDRVTRIFTKLGKII